VPDQVLIASTGVIGAPLNTEVIGKSLPGLVKALSAEAVPRVVEAIMTTDSFPKLALFEGKAGGKPYKVVGMAKGAGMIMLTWRPCSALSLATSPLIRPD